MNKFYYIFASICLLIIGTCTAIPKFEDTKNPGYSSDNQWRRSYKVNDTYAQASSQNNDRSERLGYTTGYGSGLSGYPHSGTGVGVYSPLKIDIGGIVVGAIIGIGALLIIPKILSAFNGGYGSNYRSADGSDPTGLSEMITKLDDMLSKNNIDSTTCVQRAVCNYVRSSEKNLQIGNGDQSDQIIHALSGNALVEYMLDGTAVKEALRNGKSLNGRECDSIYAGCPLDKESSMQLLTKLLPNNGQ